MSVMKEFLTKYNVGLSIVGGSVIIATSLGNCSFSPADSEEVVVEEPAAEEAPAEEAEAPAEEPVEEAEAPAEEPAE